jgi:hypothetical protein
MTDKELSDVFGEWTKLLTLNKTLLEKLSNRRSEDFGLVQKTSDIVQYLVSLLILR